MVQIRSTTHTHVGIHIACPHTSQCFSDQLRFIQDENRYSCHRTLCSIDYEHNNSSQIYVRLHIACHYTSPYVTKIVFARFIQTTIRMAYACLYLTTSLVLLIIDIMVLEATNICGRIISHVVTHLCMFFISSLSNISRTKISNVLWARDNAKG